MKTMGHELFRDEPECLACKGPTAAYAAIADPACLAIVFDKSELWLDDQIIEVRADAFIINDRLKHEFRRRAARPSDQCEDLEVVQA